MSISFFSPAMTTLQALLERSDDMLGEASADAADAYQAEYAQRAGFRLGANGEWIADTEAQRAA